MNLPCRLSSEGLAQSAQIHSELKKSQIELTTSAFDGSKWLCEDSFSFAIKVLDKIPHFVHGSIRVDT